MPTPTRIALAAVLAAAAAGAPALAQTYGSQGYGSSGQAYGGQGAYGQGAYGQGQGYDRSAYPPSTYGQGGASGYGQGARGGYSASGYDQGQGAYGAPADGQDDPQVLARRLNLTASQQSAFNAYQNAFRPDQARAQQEEAEMNRMASLTTPQRLDLARASMQRDMADFNRTDAATRAFYAQLSPTQRRTFDQLTAPQMDMDGGSGGPSPNQPASPTGR